MPRKGDSILRIFESYQEAPPSNPDPTAKHFRPNPTSGAICAKVC